MYIVSCQGLLVTLNYREINGSEQLHPKQFTTAIITYHPVAIYFIA